MYMCVCAQTPSGGTLKDFISDHHQGDRTKAREKLHIGSTIDIWWPRDQRAYKATITNITDTHVDVEYGMDGSRRTYPLDSLLAASYDQVPCIRMLALK